MNYLTLNTKQTDSLEEFINYWRKLYSYGDKKNILKIS